MKLVRYVGIEGNGRLGIVADDRIVDLEHLLRGAGDEVGEPILQADICALAADFERWRDILHRALETFHAKGLSDAAPQLMPDSVRILPPIPRPAKFICVGLNYRDHCEEQNLEPPKSPVIFAKFANAVCGHKDIVKRPAVTSKLDFEGELGVVIAQGGKKIPAEKALSHVLGYLIVNDISARDIQKKDGQWLRAKSMDTFAPTGPWITTSDEICDPQSLALKTTLNDRIMQESHTSKMIFGVAELIEFISHGITLEPGDIISTGTPAGVGVWRNPPVFLQPGDVVRIEIEKIGILENTIADEEA